MEPVITVALIKYQINLVLAFFAGQITGSIITAILAWQAWKK